MEMPGARARFLLSSTSVACLLIAIVHFWQVDTLPLCGHLRRAKVENMLAFLSRIHDVLHHNEMLHCVLMHLEQACAASNGRATMKFQIAKERAGKFPRKLRSGQHEF